MNLRAAVTGVIIIAGCGLTCNLAAESVVLSGKQIIPVTAETLIELRAAEHVPVFDYQLVETEIGAVPVTDNLATRLGATVALKKAYPVPMCLEFAYLSGPGDAFRFPFAIEANERLVDALDKLEERSEGSVKWLLLRGRIVMYDDDQNRAGKVEPYIMERPIRVHIDADLLEEALEQVETAYDTQHGDIPFVVQPPLPWLLLQSRPTDTGERGRFTGEMAGSLREVVLALLDEMRDPALCYGLSERVDGMRRRFYTLTVKKDYGKNTDPHGDTDQGLQYKRLHDASQQRLAEYLSRLEEAPE